jgi:hypothetical protein
MLDPTVVGNPLGWTMKQLRTRLPAMLERAGYGELGSQLNPQLLVEKLDELECTAREMARTHHSTTTHNRGNPVIEAGNIRFGLEIRAVGQDGGPAIHVLGDAAGQEIELLAFDCFRVNPHYHYGPRNQDERIFHDKTLVPDALAWVLTQFKSGKLPAMITRAGYPSIAAAIDADLVAEKVREVETTLKEMAAAAS